MWRHLLSLLLTIIGCTYAMDFISYHPGTLPIILGSPHGGYLLPDDVSTNQLRITKCIKLEN